MMLIHIKGLYIVAKVQWAIALESKKMKVPRHQSLYTRHVDQVILIYTIPSNLALDAPENEEKKKFNLLETEQKSHSDTRPWNPKN